MHALGRAALGLAALVAASGGAQAAITVYYGADNGAVPGGARPNADGALNSFIGATGGGSVIDFEGLSSGPNPTNLAVAPGATLTVTGNESGGIVNTDQHSPAPLGFNTTAGGSGWLQMWPEFNSAGGSVATLAFSTAVGAFGAFFTDTQDGFPGTITVSFNDGSSQQLALQKNDNNGGVLFFGFSSDGAGISSISIATGATAGTRDIWGLDDVRFVAVPEPMSLALLGSALVGLGLVRRRA